MLEQLTDIMFNTVNIFSPFLIYYPQLRLMASQQKIGSFPLSVCTIIIVSSIFRLLAALRVQFLWSLIVQSLILITFHVFISKTYFNILKKEPQPEAKESSLADQVMRVSEEELSYYRRLSMLVICALGVLFFFSFKENICMAFLYISALVESSLPTPLFFKNMKNQATEGVSLSMITMWFMGDSIKLGMFILKNQPLAFSLCASLQLFFDTLILYQFFSYRKIEKIAIIEGANSA